MTPLQFLAEVTDKEPSLVEIWLVFAGLGVLGAFLARARWWAPVLVLPAVLLFAVGIVGEITDPYVGPAIRSELGLSYVMQSIVAIATGVLLPLMAAWHAKRRVA